MQSRVHLSSECSDLESGTVSRTASKSVVGAWARNPIATTLGRGRVGTLLVKTVQIMHITFT